MLNDVDFFQQDFSNLLYLEKFSFNILWFSFDTELRRRWSHSGIGTKRLFWPVTVSTASISRISRIIVTGQNKCEATPQFIASSASWYFHYYSYQAIVNVLLWCSQSWIVMTDITFTLRTFAQMIMSVKKVSVAFRSVNFFHKFWYAGP